MSSYSDVIVGYLENERDQLVRAWLEWLKELVPVGRRAIFPSAATATFGVSPAALPQSLRRVLA